MEMTPGRWNNTCAYLREAFGREDAVAARIAPRAKAAGLPEIAVSADVGRLLKLLASMTNGGRGASLIVEIGALAGYSALWLARGLAPDGRLITIEPEPKHAAVVAETFRDAGLAGRTEIITEPAPSCLPTLAARLGPASIDVLFFDAIKRDYAEYLRLMRPCLRIGGLLIADNCLGSGHWWIDEPAPGVDADRDGIDAFNRAVAADPEFDAACVPNREGVLIARRIK